MSTDRMHDNALVEILALLDRLDRSGQSFDTDLIRAHVPQSTRDALADEVARLNWELESAGY